MTQAVFLVGGLGTRLGEATKRLPKPLLPIAGRPFLDYLVEDVARHGITDCLFLAQFESGQIRQYCATTPLRERFGLTMRVCEEPPGAGTGGALWHAQDELADHFLLLNGDSWINGNYLELIRLLSAPGSQGAIALRHVEDPGRYGRVTVEGGRVIDFREKDRTAAEPGLINAGVYALPRSIVSQLSPTCSLERDALPVLAKENGLLAAEFPGYFIDIGVPDTLAEAREGFAEHFRRPAVFFDRDGVLNHDYGHVGTIDRFAWMPGAEAAIKLVNDNGWLAFVVTNQAGVAKGFYDEAAVYRLHRHMQSELAAAGAHIDDFRHCPFHEDGIVSEYSRSSYDRKPEPGMILDLASNWRVDLASSVLVGDKQSDVEAARRAEITGLLFDASAPLDQWLSRVIPLESPRYPNEKP